MASVTLREIRKTYEDRDRGRKGQTVDVIKGVDLSIGDGEFLVLVGPSGCGKSTLLRMIAGLEDITSGELAIGDRVVNDVPPKDRGIGMVFQSYALYPHMTVRENMAFGLKLRKTEPSVITARVEEAARQLDLTPYLERLPKQLSGGQRQRVAIGRAIVRQPEVFLFDEPLSNLDAALRNQMRIELKKLHLRLRSTMIYVTHDQVEAMTLADRIAILNKGVVQQIGTPAEVFDTPANRFVASFIGSPGMNFLSGAVAGGVFRGDGFEIPVGDAEGVDVVGLRPQHLHVHHGADTPRGWGILDAELDVVEPMGWEALLHLRVGTHSLIAHVEMDQARDLRPGDHLTLVVEPEHLHAFGEDGRRVDLSSPGHDEEE